MHDQELEDMVDLAMSEDAVHVLETEIAISIKLILPLSSTGSTLAIETGSEQRAMAVGGWVDAVRKTMTTTATWIEIRTT